MIHPKFYGTITGPNFTLDHPDRFKQYLTQLAYKKANARIEIVVKRVRKVRSVKQNNYYWLCLTAIANWNGDCVPNEIHDYFKAKYLVDRSRKVPVIKSTTELSTLDFMDYMTKIGIEMANLGFTLPSPDDYLNE